MDDLILEAKCKAEEIYGLADIYKEICSRIDEESDFIKKYYESYLTLKEIVKICKKENVVMYIDGTIGNSLIAYLNDITDINPLKPHYYCDKCGYGNWDLSVKDGYDLPIKKCPNCGKLLNRDGHDLEFNVHKVGFEEDLGNGGILGGEMYDDIFTGVPHNRINTSRDMIDRIKALIYRYGSDKYIDTVDNGLCFEYAEMLEIAGYTINSYSLSSILNHLDSIKNITGLFGTDEYKRLENIIKPSKFSDYTRICGLVMGRNTYENFSKYHLNKVPYNYDDLLDSNQHFDEHTNLSYKSGILTRLIFIAKLSWLIDTFPKEYRLINKRVDFIGNAYRAKFKIYPEFTLKSTILRRINHEEWIYDKFYDLFYMIYQLTEYCNQHDIPYAHESMINASLVACLNGMTEINPLTPHYYCKVCKAFEFNDDYEIFLDMPDKYCDICGNKLDKKGCNLNIDYYAREDSTKNLDIVIKIPINSANTIMTYLEYKGYNVEIINDVECLVWTKDGEYQMTLILDIALDKLEYVAKEQGIKCNEIPIFNLDESEEFSNGLYRCFNGENSIMEGPVIKTYHEYARLCGFNRTLSKPAYELVKEFHKDKPSNKDEMIDRLIQTGLNDKEAYQIVNCIDDCITNYNKTENKKAYEFGIANLLSKSQCIVNMFIDLRLMWYQNKVGEIEIPKHNDNIYSIVEEFIVDKYGYLPNDLYELKEDRVIKIVEELESSYYYNVILVSYGLEYFQVEKIAKNNIIFNFDTLENMADFMFIVNCFKENDAPPNDIWEYYDTLCRESWIIKNIEYKDLLLIPENASIMHLCVNMGSKTRKHLTLQYSNSIIAKRFNHISIGSCYMDNDIKIEKIFYV